MNTDGQSMQWLSFHQNQSKLAIHSWPVMESLWTKGFDGLIFSDIISAGFRIIYFIVNAMVRLI